MILNYVTCSGTNEFTNIKEMVEMLLAFPKAEIAVQVSERQSPAGSARIEWMRELADYLQTNRLTINAALHVNRTWVEKLCKGIVVPELYDLFALQDIYGMPLFKRVQLNFKLGRDNVDAEDCWDNLRVVQHQIKRRFILSHNPSNAAIIHKLYLAGLHFDCLFDSSFGAGIAPEMRHAPMFITVMQGYAGGITPDNVMVELQKIAKAVDDSAAYGNVFIDAQKGLEDENTHLSLDKCYNYLFNAHKWYENYRWCQDFL